MQLSVSSFRGQLPLGAEAIATALYIEQQAKLAPTENVCSVLMAMIRAADRSNYQSDRCRARRNI